MKTFLSASRSNLNSLTRSGSCRIYFWGSAATACRVKPVMKKTLSLSLSTYCQLRREGGAKKRKKERENSPFSACHRGDTSRRLLLYHYTAFHIRLYQTPLGAHPCTLPIAQRDRPRKERIAYQSRHTQAAIAKPKTRSQCYIVAIDKTYGEKEKKKGKAHTHARTHTAGRLPLRLIITSSNDSRVGVAPYILILSSFEISRNPW